MAEDALADLMFSDLSHELAGDTPQTTPQETTSEPVQESGSLADSLYDSISTDPSLNPSAEAQTQDQPGPEQLRTPDSRLQTPDSRLSEPQPDQPDLLKEYSSIFDEFGGKDIVSSLKPIAETFYNPASTAEQRIQALEEVAPGSVNEILWNMASRPESRDAIIGNYFNGATYDQIVSAVNARRTEQNAEQNTQPQPEQAQNAKQLPVNDEWGNPVPENFRAHYQQIQESNQQLQSRLAAIEGAQERAAREAQVYAQQQWQAEVHQRSSAFLSDLIAPAIEVGQRLFAPSENDPPEIRQLKEDAYNTFIQSVPDMVERTPALRSRASNALGLLGKPGAEVQVERLKPALLANIGQMAARRGEFLSRLVNAEIELRSMKMQQSQQNTRPEISNGATAGTSATTVGNRNAINPADPFNIDDMLKEVADREKGGWFSRFKR
jgi:hypothetical protein